MTYELALKLKEAGFKVPLGASDDWQPSLSELIEACGDDFLSLDKNGDSGADNSWESVGKYLCCEEHGEGRKYTYGITPEIAVANLYLALNKK